MFSAPRSTRPTSSGGQPGPLGTPRPERPIRLQSDGQPSRVPGSLAVRVHGRRRRPGHRRQPRPEPVADPEPRPALGVVSRRRRSAVGEFLLQAVRRPHRATVEPTAQLRTSFTNADAARNAGIELEARSLIGPHLLVGANYTYVNSEVTLSPAARQVQTSLVRPLAGTSPNLFNTLFEVRGMGYSGRLLFNYFDDRISDVGSLGLPDIIETGTPFGRRRAREALRARQPQGGVHEPHRPALRVHAGRATDPRSESSTWDGP